MFGFYGIFTSIEKPGIFKDVIGLMLSGSCEIDIYLKKFKKLLACSVIELFSSLKWTSQEYQTQWNVSSNRRECWSLFGHLLVPIEQTRKPCLQWWGNFWSYNRKRRHERFQEFYYEFLSKLKACRVFRLSTKLFGIFYNN